MNLDKNIRDTSNKVELTQQHEKLDKLRGEWKAYAKWRPSPESNFTESIAKVTREIVLGGLFLNENYDATDSNPSFAGIGIYGFDKPLSKYTYVWIDTMSSTIWHSIGEYNESDNTITFIAKGSDSDTNSHKIIKSKLKFISNNENKFEMFDLTSEGEVFKSLEITYKRV